jgi:hypothetical protein
MKTEIAKIALAEARRRRELGEVPTMLGLPGILALMYDNIRRSDGGADHDEVMELASNSLFALELALKAADVEIEEELGPPPTQEEEDMALPEEFLTWRYDPKVAQSFKEWLIEEGDWDQLSESNQKEIELVAGGTVIEAEEEDEEAEPSGT